MFRPEEYAVSLRRMRPSPIQQIAGLDESKVTLPTKHTVDGQYPAPPRMMIIQLFIGF